MTDQADFPAVRQQILPWAGHADGPDAEILRGLREPRVADRELAAAIHPGERGVGIPRHVKRTGPGVQQPAGGHRVDAQNSRNDCFGPGSVPSTASSLPSGGYAPSCRPGHGGGAGTRSLRTAAVNTRPAGAHATRYHVVADGTAGGSRPGAAPSTNVRSSAAARHGDELVLPRRPHGEQLRAGERVSEHGRRRARHVREVVRPGQRHVVARHRGRGDAPSGSACAGVRAARYQRERGREHKCRREWPQPRVAVSSALEPPRCQVTSIRSREAREGCSPPELPRDNRREYLISRQGRQPGERAVGFATW